MLILWNGTNDTAISPRDTQRYYNRVVEKMGRDAADETVELFLAPGVGHCAGGARPDQVDLLMALSTWVENGTPPSRQNLVLTKQDKLGDPVTTRPMCKFVPGSATRGQATLTPRRVSSAQWNDADGPRLIKGIVCWLSGPGGRPTPVALL
jgi:feruloyl esterase